MPLTLVLPRGSQAQSKRDVPDLPVKGWYGEETETGDARGAKEGGGGASVGFC